MFIYKVREALRELKKMKKAMASYRNCMQKPWVLSMAIAGLMVGALLVAGWSRSADRSFFCSLGYPYNRVLRVADPATPIQLEAVLHYATTTVVPQQNLDEVRISYNVIRRLAPCNFLVFGLGHDSLMWASFNSRGVTLFLEEDPTWVQSVLKDAPMLNARTVDYRTHLSEADELLSSYKSEPACLPPRVRVEGNQPCRLALHNLPDEVYEREWDMIMIDAPRGYFAEAPGRMAAIYSVAVMARNRQKEGPTHVFLHDVDRRVERIFAEEFLCAKFRVEAVGRLWHFVIPAVRNWKEGDGFC